MSYSQILEKVIASLEYPKELLADRLERTAHQAQAIQNEARMRGEAMYRCYLEKWMRMFQQKYYPYPIDRLILKLKRLQCCLNDIDPAI